MPLEDGRQGKDKQNPENLRNLMDERESADNVAASESRDVTSEKLPAAAPPATHQEADTAIEEVMKPKSPEELEQIDKSYYAEASLAKKVTVFTVTTVLILIALGLIYAYVPLGTVK